MRNLKAKLLAGMAALIGLAGVSNAAPLIQLSLVGRITGSGNPYSSSVVLPASTSNVSVDYEILLVMAPTNTTNVQGTTTRTVTGNTDGTDGVNSLKIDMFQTSTADPQANLTTAAVLNTDPSATISNDSWAAGSGATGGTPTLRASTTNDDLLAIRPIHASGVFTGVIQEIMASGTFAIPNTGSVGSTLGLRWSTASGNSGGAKINGSTSIVITGTTEASSDPFVGYTNLALVVPEPASMGLLSLASLGLLGVRRRKA